MFRKDRMGGSGGGGLLYIKETIPAYEVQLQEEADTDEAMWCKLVTGHTTITIRSYYFIRQTSLLWYPRYSI